MTDTATESIVELVAAEARAARTALPSLTDERVERALSRAAELVDAEAETILAANRRDLDVASATLDDGALDRLLLDERRLAAIAAGARATATLEPIARDVSEWRLVNGLHVVERRIPIGVVGANFEARPNVAVDVAAQVLKSGNAVVLRTGGAALATVTALVDHALRPALDGAGVDGHAVGLVRTPARAGAETLVSLPDLLPLVILRG